MKPFLKIVIILGVILTASLSIGASRDVPARPLGVSSEQWIALGDQAGFALTEGKGPVVAELYVRTKTGWSKARIDNPVSVIPVR